MSIALLGHYSKVRLKDSIAKCGALR
jgi:hypothetical protein